MTEQGADGKSIGGATNWPGLRRAQLAQEWARQGVAVFPLNWITPQGTCACGRRECGSPGKDPVGRVAPRGVHDASKDPATINRMWHDYPFANIGLAMGRVSGVWALDIDPAHGGDETIAALEAEHGALPDTAQTHTGGGGRHLFFAYDQRVKNSAGTLGAGLDTRSDGGYVVGAGSNHLSGRDYVRDVEFSFGDCPLAMAPEWLVELLSRSGSSAIASDGETLPATWDRERNNRLFVEACALRRRGWTAEEIAEALIRLDAERSKPPKGPEYCRDMARRIVRRYAPAGELELWMSDQHWDDAELDPRPAAEIHPLTEIGNADRLVERHGHNVRYCYSQSRWLAWDGQAWSLDATGIMTQLARETILALEETEKGKHLGPPNSKGDQEDMLPKHIKSSSNRRSLENMVILASSSPRILVPVEKLDTHHFLLPVANGTIDLAAGTLHKSQRDHLMTYKVPIAYDTDATAPRFERFVREIFDHDDELVRFAQSWFGYCLTGSMTESKLAIFYGQGANGKSVLLDAIAAAMGPYSAVAAQHTFDAEQSSSIPSDLAAMRGARLVMTTETEERYELEMSIVKRITGGDVVRARFMFKDWFSYRPCFKVILATNKLPKISGTDHGTWRRVLNVPFMVQFGQPGYPPAEDKARLEAQLYEERQGILRWLVIGAIRWQRHGLQIPASVQRATESYRDSEDTIAPFVDECLRRVAGRDANKADVYRRYVIYSEQNKQRPVGMKTFAQRMIAKGFQEQRLESSRCWRDCELLDPTYHGHVPFGDN